MSPSDKDIIIIDGLIATEQFDPLEEAALKEIRNKPEGRCSAKDADTVARLVKNKLRRKR